MPQHAMRIQILTAAHTVSVGEQALWTAADMCLERDCNNDDDAPNAIVLGHQKTTLWHWAAGQMQACRLLTYV